MPCRNAIEVAIFLMSWVLGMDVGLHDLMRPVKSIRIPDMCRGLPLTECLNNGPVTWVDVAVR